MSLSHLITDLADSVDSFHQRFEIVGLVTRAELLTRIPIQSEEVEELNKAILVESDTHVAQEAVDVLYVAIGTVLRLNPLITEDAIRQVIAKNNAKTTKTHFRNQAGKVVRQPVGNETGT
tara:strand:- start:79 stop:438 length:360 start_codon:yes stop_codon:yes gene_type:complete